MILVWRMLSKVLRRVGRRALLAPVAVLGAALFALNTWTVATLLCALLVAVLAGLMLLGRRSAGTSSVLPLAMLGAGICGLWAAATMAGSWVKGGSITSLISGIAGKPRPDIVWHTKFGSTTVIPSSRAAWNVRSGAVHAQVNALQHKASYVAQAAAGPRRPKMPPGVYRTAKNIPVPGHSLMWGRLLILGSLLLLALGLWLAPRALADLREHYGKVSPRLTRWVREGNWGMLLVPVTCFGLTVFGVRPWTVAAVIAAVVIAIRWPRLAADLVPVVLVGFALCGFVLAARWIPGPLGPTRFTASPPGPFGPASAAFAGPKGVAIPGGPPPWAAMPAQPIPSATWFGAVPVDSLPSSLLAGVEASMMLAFGAWLFPRTLGAHITGKTPGQAAALAGRVQRLTETRTQAVDAAAAELRRIERDLHDGTQARLVALGMNLRALERMLPASEPGALALVAEAKDTSLRALNDLRHLVRGIYPPVLADRGLAHAVQALALDTPMPVEIDIDLPGRLSAPVESACYFAVAEILANAVKHSGAHRVHIRMQHRDGVLRIEVADDGTGGADPSAGTGLRGVERRLGTFDGILAVSSPVGGPTMIAMEVPCVLSSQKTYSS